MQYVRKIPFKKPREKMDKPIVFKGREIPDDRARGKATRAEKNKALKYNGSSCLICGQTKDLEAHHVIFQENGGRGQYRNIRHLCGEHHRGKFSPHKNEQVRRMIETMHEEVYGPYYHCDKYDLFINGLIPNTTDEAFEEFMQEEEKKARFRRIDAESSEAAWF